MPVSVPPISRKIPSGDKEKSRDCDFSGVQNRIQYWFWVAIGLAAIVIALVPLPILTPAPVTRTLIVETSSFEFNPSVLTVNPGDRVTLEVTSSDVVHGLYIEGYDSQVTADPGQTASLTFIADRQGSFRIRCSVTCGSLHPFMIGKLKVGPNLLLWRGIGLVLLVSLAGLWTIRK